MHSLSIYNRYHILMTMTQNQILEIGLSYTSMRLLVQPQKKKKKELTINHYLILNSYYILWQYGKECQYTRCYLAHGSLVMMLSAKRSLSSPLLLVRVFAKFKRSSTLRCSYDSMGSFWFVRYKKAQTMNIQIILINTEAIETFDWL